MKRVEKAFRSVSWGLVASMASLTCYASEGGGGSYVNGTESTLSGDLPPPGDYLLNYNLWYQAKKFANPSPVFNHFRVVNTASVIRYVHVSSYKIFGANWGFQMIGAEVNPSIHNLAQRNQRTSGLSDLTIDPFILGWHAGDWNIVSGLDIYLPVGRYNKEDIANTGNNYFTFQPVVAVTWLNPAGYEFSIKTMYDINTANHATDYRSGQAIHADYALAKHINQWTLGVSGYAYQQLQKDSGEGTVFGGFKGRTFANGPEIGYTTDSHITIRARYLHEYQVKNRPKGDSIWLNAVVPL